ncbi:hypothetical protein [Chitinophaga jiangningensis]|nr:hypothetical protein [Chitinophaga jiangningensis]
MDYYSFLTAYCNCTGVQVTEKEAAGYYDYFEKYCVCQGCIHILPMMTTEDQEPNSYPVNVLNIHLDVIGKANNKIEYINIWNQDLQNQQVGQLSGAAGPFSFVLLAIDCENLINAVHGNPVDTYIRLFEHRFENLFE